MGHKFKVIHYSKDNKTREKVRTDLECSGPVLTTKLQEDLSKKGVKTDWDAKRLILKTKKVPLRPNDQIGTNEKITEYVTTEVDKGMVHGSISIIKDIERDKRKRYILVQVYDIADHFYEKTGEPLELVGRNLDYLIIRNYRLPRLCNYAKSPLVIHFPATYPENPPIGYYIKAGIVMKYLPHLFDSSYYDAPDLSGKNLCWVCLHEKSRGCAWHHDPGDPLKEDNLWTFLQYVDLGLSVKDLAEEDRKAKGRNF